MICRARASLLVLVLSIALFPARVSASKSLKAPSCGPAGAKCDFFGIPDTKWLGFSDVVVDTGGLPWIMANNKVFYWAGDRFREPTTGPMSSGYYVAGLYGSPDRGAYASQRGEEEHQGLLYRLDDGAATFVTTFYFDVSHECPGLYVSKSGTLFNWGSRFLARYDGQKWERIEARLSLRSTVIFDLGDQVYFYYDNSLYRAEHGGKLETLAPPTWRAARPGQNRIIGALWGGDKAVLIESGKPRLLAFDLATCEKVDVSAIEAQLGKTRLYDLRAFSNGDVWIVGRRDGVAGCLFLRLAADGHVSEISAIKDVPWSHVRCWQFPESVLETSDGSVLFGLPQDGIAIYRDGEVSRCGWRRGFFTAVRHLHEDFDGNIWCPVSGKIARFRLSDGLPPVLPRFRAWEEIALAPGSGIWELRTGELAMFRADKPGVLSRWDGSCWTFQEVPFDTSRTGRSLTDERGHLLLAMAAYPDGHFDVGPASVRRFEDMRTMLQQAVADGVELFRHDSGFQGVVVTPEKRLWFGYHHYNTTYYFDGTRWDSFSFRDDVYYLFRSPAHGVLVRTQGGRFYRYDRGQMVEVRPPFSRTRRLLIGTTHLQPYERALAESFPGHYYPVLRANGAMRLFFDLDAFESAGEGLETEAWPASVELPRYTKRIAPAASGGAWVFGTGGSEPPSRLFGRERMQINTAGTPLAGKPLRDVKEDAAGGLWFLTYYGGLPRAFFYKQSGTRLTIENPPSECERSLRLKVHVYQEDQIDTVRLFTRVNAADWSAVVPEDSVCVFRFPETGHYRCEATGLKLGGRLESPPAFVVHANVKLPETKLTGRQIEHLSVDTMEWRPPVLIEKTSEEATPTLLWRIGAGDWRQASGDGPISFADVEPGTYQIEFCAQEEDLWRDPSPLRLTVTFAPDYEKIVAAYLEQLTTGNAARRRHAMEMLSSLGVEAVPAMEHRLEEAERAALLVHPLREILEELRPKEGTKAPR